MTRSHVDEALAPAPVLPDVTALYDAHADFVWASLHRLGVRDADLPDMLQEVFVVVHRRLDSYDGATRATTWLFGICLRVAAGYRRRAHRRYEDALEPGAHEPLATEPTPEEHLEARQARAQLAEVLDGMDLEKRAVFVMFELEQLPCAEIAELTGLPVGTVHSRLHAARQQFAEAAARFRRRCGAVPREGGR